MVSDLSWEAAVQRVLEAFTDPMRCADIAEQSGALRALGMYWRRDHVVWRGKPKLFGRQGIAATRVNFTD